MRPIGPSVLIAGSRSRKDAPLLSISCTMFSTSRVERPSLSSSWTTTTSPSRRKSRTVCSSVLPFRLPPETFSMRMTVYPAACSFPSQSFEVLRREPLVWVTAADHVARSLDPLPVALFEPGCAARMNVIDALSAAGRAYRSTYSSASLLGFCAAVQAGLAVAGLAASSVPSTLTVIGDAEGLPPMQPLDMSLIRRSGADSAAVSRLHEFLTKTLRER